MANISLYSLCENVEHLAPSWADAALQPAWSSAELSGFQPHCLAGGAGVRGAEGGVRVQTAQPARRPCDLSSAVTPSFCPGLCTPGSFLALSPRKSVASFKV